MSGSLEIAKRALKSIERDIERHCVCITILEKLDSQLCDIVIFSPQCYITTVIRNRDDLKTLMSIAPVWKKAYNTDSIRYTADYLGHEITIFACDSALPTTCILVEEEVDVPAKPAHKEIRLKLSCNEKITNSTQEPTESNVPTTTTTTT